MAWTLEVPELELSEQVAVNPERTALLIADMQNDFVDPKGTLFVAAARQTIAACQRLLRFAREQGLLVIYTQDTHRPGSPEWALWGEHVQEDSWGWEIIPELVPQEGDLVIRKPRYDAFYATELDHQLRLRRVDTLIICGTVANICVQYTAAGAGHRWYKIIHPVDAISGFSTAEKAAALGHIHRLFQATLAKAENITAITSDD